MSDLALRKIERELWRRGVLRWKLHEGQHDLHDFLYSLQKIDVKVGTFRIARRFGKTFDLCAFSMERCISEEGIKIPFLAPTVKALKKIVIPIFNQILLDCPKEIRPKFSRQDSIYTFPTTGSEIILGGTDAGNAENMRGIRAKYGILDEAGFMNDLRYIINDIMLPTLMYDNGFLGVSSTPPPSPDHYFVELLASTEIKNASIHRTVWQNPMIAVKEILEFADAAGCVIDWDRFADEHCFETMYNTDWAKSLILSKSISFRREFEAEILVDPTKAVIPELTDEMAAIITRETKMPDFCEKMVTIDTGFVDYTGVTFGYYDFARAKAVVQDDLLIDFSKDGMNLDKFVSIVRAKEKELWGIYEPTARYADGDLIVLSELNQKGLTVSPVRKDALEAQVNQTRTDIKRQRVEISPKARNTLTHAKYATWNNQKTGFTRSESCGHFDCLASLIYFLRHIDRGTNPEPDLLNVDRANSYIPKEMLKHKDIDTFNKIINRG